MKSKTIEHNSEKVTADDLVFFRAAYPWPHDVEAGIAITGRIDSRAAAIAETHGGEMTGTGHLAGDVRTLDFEIPKARVKACKSALHDAGFGV